MRKLKVLLLCNRPARGADASAVVDHLDAFKRLSRHEIFELSFIRELPSRLALERFDTVVIHYSTALGYYVDHYISPLARERVRSFRGLKVAFIQDDYRRINDVKKVLRFLGIDVLFSLAPPRALNQAYPEAALPGVLRMTTLAGYVPGRLLVRRVSRIAERTIDVGYRTRKVPFWLGQLGVEKWQIADQFAEYARGSGLRLDIAYNEADRLYGEKWIDFVASCKAMLGVESGASVCDFTGEIQENVEAHIRRDPTATFETVRRLYFEDIDGKIVMNIISPRCFEAAALRTAMVLFEGEYSGLLEPWRHYIPLKKDFSNFSRVLAALRDHEGLQKMVDRAFEEIACNPANSYRTFISQFDDVIEHEFSARGKAFAKQPYEMKSYRGALLGSFGYSWKRLTSRVLQRMLLGTGLRRWMFRLWGQTPITIRHAARPLLRIIGR